MGFKTQDGFQFTGSGDGLKYVSGKRISFYISEQGDVGSGDAGVYSYYSTKAIFAPALASSIASSLPMPDPEPVITATLSAKFFIYLS